MKQQDTNVLSTKLIVVWGRNIYFTAFGSANSKDLDDSYALLKAYESALTVNQDHSELMAVNQAAGIRPISVSDATYQLTNLRSRLAKKILVLTP